MSKIELSDEFVEKISFLSEKDEAFEDTLKRIIGCYENNFKNINRDQDAFTLTFEPIGREGCEYITVTYKELANSKIGDMFEVQKLDSTYYINQKAKIIYKDDESVLVKFIDEIYTESKKLEEFEIVAYHFL